jgi:hypothetical protein
MPMLAVTWISLPPIECGAVVELMIRAARVATTA